MFNGIHSHSASYHSPFSCSSLIGSVLLEASSLGSAGEGQPSMLPMAKAPSEKPTAASVCRDRATGSRGALG